MRPLRMQMRRQDPFAQMITSGEQCGSCAIAKKHGNRSPAGGHVQSATVVFTADEQDVFIHAGFDELVGHRKSIDKTTALVANIKRRASVNIEQFLHQYSRSGKIIIGTEGGKDNQVYIILVHSSAF